MKKISALLVSFVLLISPPVFCKPNFEEIKATASPVAEAPLSFVEDRTFDDEVKGRPQLPTDFFAQGPLSPSNILLSTTIGERVVESLANNQAPLIPGPTSQFSLNFEKLTAKMESDFHNAFFGNTDPSRVTDLINQLSAAIKQGGGDAVWNQPVVALTEYSNEARKVFSSYLDALASARNADDVKAAATAAQTALAPLAAIGEGASDVLAARLNDLLGKGLHSAKIAELKVIFKEGFSHVQNVLVGGVNALSDTAQSGPCKDGSFWCLPQVDDEVVTGITVGNEADVLEIFNHYRPQLSSDEAAALESVLLTTHAELEKIETAFFDIWHDLVVVFNDTDGKESVSLRQFGHTLGITIWDYEHVVQGLYRNLIQSFGNAENEKEILSALAVFAGSLNDATEKFQTESNEQFLALIKSSGKGNEAALQEIANQFFNNVHGYGIVLLKGAQNMAFSLLPEIGDEVVTGITVGHEADVLEFFESTRPDFLAAIGEGASDALAVFADNIQKILSEDITKILIGMNKILEDDQGGLLDYSIRRLGVYIDDIIIGLRKGLSQYALALSKATTTEDIALAAQDAHAAVETVLKQFHADLENLKAVIPTWWGLLELVPHTIDLWESVLEIGSVARNTINQVAGHALLKQLQSEVSSFFDIWIEMGAKTEGQYPAETQELNEGLHAAMDDYLKAVFNNFMDYVDDALIAKNPAERAAAAKSAQSKLLLAQNKLIKTTEALFSNFASKVDDKTKLLLSSTLVNLKKSITQLGLTTTSWISIFSNTWTACMYPMCGGM